MKVDIQYFDGHLGIEEFMDWLSSVETFFEYMNIPEDKRVKLVAYKFKGGASTWWEQLNGNKRRKGKSSIQSWPKMRKLLRSRFLPNDYSRVLFQKYHHFNQQNKSVDNYIEEFCRLSARNNLHESEDQLVSRYIRGLSFPIQEKLELSPVWTLYDAINLASKVETQLQRTASKILFKWKPEFQGNKQRSFPHTTKQPDLQPQPNSKPIFPNQSP